MENTNKPPRKRKALSTADLEQLGEIVAAKLLAASAAAPPQAPPQPPPDEKPKRKRRVIEPVKYFTEEQIDQLLAVPAAVARKAVPDSQAYRQAIRNIAIIRLAYHRGLRADEISQLQFGDWQQERDRISFRRLKGSHGGEYFMTKKEILALRAWKKIRGTDPGPLFPSRQGSRGGGKGISQQMLDVIMKRYGEAAGLPEDRRHMHTLKHSCATHLMAKDIPLEQVQDHLGHVSIKSTEVYAKLRNSQREARDRRLRDW